VSNFNQQNKKPPNILSDYKYRLLSDPVQGARKRPTLELDFYKNNPRFIVRTQVDGDKDHGRIQAPMDADTMFAIMQSIEDMATGKLTERKEYQHWDYYFMNGKRSDDVVKKATTIIDRDEDGVMFIAVIAKDRPKIKFHFKYDMYTKLFINGVEASPEVASNDAAMSYKTRMVKIIPKLLVNNFVPYVPPNQNNGGNGGGYNNNNGGGNYGNNNDGGYNGNGGGGNQGASAPTDDDIPW
jgi:hypothetical protein